MTDSSAIASRVTKKRAGFSLIEMMISMVMLAIVLSSLGALTISLARKSRATAGKSFQTGLFTQEIDRAVAVPIESLAANLGQTKVDTPVTLPWPFERRVSIAGRADSLTVTVKVRPLDPLQRGDSVVQSVLRTR